MREKMTLRMMGGAMIVVLATVCVLGAAQADQVKVNVALGQPFLLANQTQTTYLKIGLTGFFIERRERRTPVNVAIVLDKSGSMRGQKIQQAKEAAIMAIRRLGPNDIVSVIAYDDTVQVLVPATKVSNRVTIEQAIRRLYAGGTTALFAGVSKGAEEVRKFLDRNRVNRVILLSDGLANVGPSSPEALGALGASLAKEGISVTTFGLGLGYNEDLMVRLARASDGNHAFIEGPADLARIFNYEFGDILSVVAQEVVVEIRCANGVRPVRLLGRKGDITGPTVTTVLNQLYSNQEKYVLLEVEVPAGSAGTSREVAAVTVSYANMATKTTDRLTSTVSVRFTDSVRTVEEKTNTEVMVAAVAQIANESNRLAVALRDQGKIEEARQALKENWAYLRDNADRYRSDELRRQGEMNKEDADNLAPGKWVRGRKLMRKRQYEAEQQQAY